jgi:hypothetical protein
LTAKQVRLAILSLQGFARQILAEHFKGEILDLQIATVFIPLCCSGGASSGMGACML